MADVKESALTQQSDCKWVRALDANGNSIRISKEELASVVGGLLYSTEAYPFMDRGSLPGGTDLNTVKVSGIYRTNGGNNFPDTEDDFPLTFSILKIYKSGYALVQEITNINFSYINHFYIRVSQDEGNTWYSWKKIL